MFCTTCCNKKGRKKWMCIVPNQQHNMLNLSSNTFEDYKSMNLTSYFVINIKMINDKYIYQIINKLTNSFYSFFVK